MDEPSREQLNTERLKAVRLLSSFTSEKGAPIFTGEVCEGIVKAMTQEELSRLILGAGYHQRKNADYLGRIYEVYGRRGLGAFFMFSESGRDYPSENSILETLAEATDYVSQPANEAVIRLSMQQTDS